MNTTVLSRILTSTEIKFCSLKEPDLNVLPALDLIDNDLFSHGWILRVHREIHLLLATALVLQ